MSNEPNVIFQSGADELVLEEGGAVYRPGDVMPASLSHAQRLSLQAAGFRFLTLHSEPAPARKAAPAVEAELAAEMPRRAASKE